MKMRPEVLFDLFSDIKNVSGIGKAALPHLKRLIGSRVIDLYWHAPVNTQARRGAFSIEAAKVGELVTLKVRVGGHQSPRGGFSRRSPYKVMCYDDTGRLDLLFFHPKTAYIQSQLPLEVERVVSGKIEIYNGIKNITHPDYIGESETYAQWVGVEPIYPLTYGLTQNMIQRYITRALSICPNLPEWIEPAELTQGNWLSWKDSIHKLHNPSSDSDLDPISPIRRRLAYDEMLATQLALQLIRRYHQRQRGVSLEYSFQRRHQILASIPFKLTSDQEKALKDIDKDMNSSYRMVRLLQGDVGSGKTIIAFLAMLNAVEAGAQAALMAPTEILARQHLQTFQEWANSLGVTVQCLTGNDTSSIRKDIIRGLQTGSIDMVIGTHSLIQKDIQFKKLQVAIIDEQHRFGVEQRLALVNKGEHTDLLVMSATPIPRTLMMTAYGDLNASLLREKPADRKEIDTRMIDMDRIAEIVEGLKRALLEGKKAYWVCPLVEESEESDLAAAEQRHTLLKLALNTDKVGLIHGRMSQGDKDQAMEKFLQGDLSILVSTTVIEVGINVPDATIMVIEHAERFGLAQLHQLRGRIGRSHLRSMCILLYQKPLSDTAYNRLKKMRETNDGFEIAEEDLRLRGGGEVLSSKQSGIPNLKIADYFYHQDLLLKANYEAEKIMATDPDLLSERGKKLRTLLYLFDCEQMIHHLKGG